MNLTLTELCVIAGVPSAVIGFAVWMLKRWIEKKEQKRQKQEDIRTEISVAMVAAINAAIGLGEATAAAVQRIPDAHCNGDMQAALDYARQVKNAQKDLLFRAGIKSANDGS